MFDWLLTTVAWTVPDGAWRQEVVAVARQAGANQGIVGRSRELASMVAFGLRLRSWRATTGSIRVAWSQGAALGAMLLLSTALVHQLASAVDGGRAGADTVASAGEASVAGGGSGGWLVVAREPSLSGGTGPIVAWGAAALMAAGLAGAAAGRRGAALALAVLGLGASVAGQAGDMWHPAVSAQAVGLVALFAAHLTATRQGAASALDAPAAVSCVRSRWLWRRAGVSWRRVVGDSSVLVPLGRRWLGVIVPTALAVMVVGAPAATAVTWTATLLVPAGLLALGGADARLAAAAAVTWAWRFLALDPTDVVDAVVVLGTREGVDVVLVRLAVMASGVAVAIAVTLHSSRRATAL